MPAVHAHRDGASLPRVHRRSRSRQHSGREWLSDLQASRDSRQVEFRPVVGSDFGFHVDPPVHRRPCLRSDLGNLISEVVGAKPASPTAADIRRSLWPFAGKNSSTVGTVEQASTRSGERRRSQCPDCVSVNICTPCYLYGCTE